MAVTERRAVSARRDSLLGDEPGAFAVARFARITPMKARRVVDLVRGMGVNDALATLRFAPQAASETVYKVLASAVSNAESTEDLSADQLVVTRAFVDEGPTMKRHRPRAQGRATRINKRTSHITIVVAPETAPAPADARRAAAKSAEKATAKKAPAKKATAKKAAADEAPAKKATAKKAAEESTAKKSTAKKSAAKSAASTDEKEA